MNAIVNFKTDKDIKEEAQKTAKSMGVSLSAVMNMYLYQFVHTKSLQVQAPTDSYDNLKDSVKRDIVEAEADYHRGNLTSFSKPKEAIGFLEDLMKK